MNTYGYVLGNPLSYSDKNGLKVIFDEGAPEIEILKADYEALKTTSHGAKICKQLEGLPDTYIITTRGANNEAWYNGEVRTIRIDPNFRPMTNTTDGDQLSDPIAIMGHEVGHAATKVQDSGPDRMDNITKNENPVRRELGLPERTTYTYKPTEAKP